MAFSLITNSAGVSITAGVDTTGATLIVLGASYDSAATVSDSKTNTWSSAVVDTSTNTHMRIWYCVNPTVGAAHTFSVSLSYCAIFMVAFSGVASVPLDQTNSGTVNPGTSLSTGSVTPSEANELIISFLAAGGTATTFAEDTPATITNSLTAVSGVSFGGSMAYEIQTTATTRNSGWSWANSAICAGGIATFKSPAVATGKIFMTTNTRFFS
jgi:hypothetical protein